MTTRELLQMALNALEYLNVTAEHKIDPHVALMAISRIRAHLAKPEPKNIVGALHVRDLGIVSSSIKQPIPDGDYYVVSQDQI
jgi:hypothetical protein